MFYEFIINDCVVTIVADSYEEAEELALEYYEMIDNEELPVVIPQ